MKEQPTDTSQQATDKVANKASIGEVLRESRNKAGYSINYIASQTHLSGEVIEALEHDQYDQLPNAVFVKGYIRSYAKLLDIDIEHMLSDYSRSDSVECVTPEVKKPKKIKSSVADPIVIGSSVTVVALLIGLVLTWWMHRDDTELVELAAVVEQFDSKDVKTKDPAIEQASNSINDTQLKETHQISLGEVDPKHISGTQNVEFKDQQIDVIDDPSSAKMHSSEHVQDQVDLANTDLNNDNIIESPVSGGDIDKVRITVRYTQESWTEIFDARKRRLLHGLIKPGSIRVITGQAPFNVFLGNSPGVELEINGEPFDHSDYKRRNNTARFLINDINS